MSIESKVLGGVFNFDNFAKYYLCNELKYPNVTVDYDVVFSDTNPKLLKCDLHYDKDSKRFEKYPVLVNIHGGGWIIGDKINSKGFCLQIANAGFFVMNINYGLPPEYKFPYQIQTHFMAFEWLEKNAEKYNLDLNNVFVSGDSAGAHMAAVVAACQASPEYGEKLGIRPTSIKIKGALLFSGIYDVDLYNKIPIGRSMMQEFVGMKDITKSPLHKYLNPIPYVNENMCRTLVVNGMTDIMTITQSKRMVKRLESCGVPYEFYEGKCIINAFHDFVLLAFTNESKKCMKVSMDFLNETVRDY